MRKLVRSALGAVAIVCLLATGRGAGVAPLATTQAGAAAVEQWVPLAGPLEGAGSKPVTLRFLDQSGSPWDEGHLAMIAEFQRQYPTIRIQREAVPYEELYRKIQTSIAAASPPDIMYADGPAVAGYAANGALLPLDGFLSPQDRRDFHPTALAEGSWLGKLYGLASEQSAPVMYYRLDAFDEAGVKPPTTLDAAWTWPQAREALRRVTKIPPQGGIPERYGVERIFGQYTLMSSIRSAGDRRAGKFSTLYKAWAQVSQDGKTVKSYLDAPEVIEAFKFFQEMWKEGSMAKERIPDAMPTGRAAAWVGAEWAEGRLLAAFKDLKWSATPLPYFRAPFVHGGSYSYVVSVGTKNQKEAGLFVLWMTSAKAEKLWYKHNPQLPARLSVLRDIDAYKTFPKSLTLQSFERWSGSRIATPVFSQYAALLDEMVRNVISGGDVEREVHQFADKVQRTLDEYWASRK
jgi:fructooligosaccharide transport system substrate-binding protein